jgi:hypothetical protein
MDILSAMLRYSWCPIVLLLLVACTTDRVAIGHSFDETGRPCTTYETTHEGEYVTECGGDRTSPEPIPSLAMPDQPVVESLSPP